MARSKFPSQNVQNTPGADHFWQLSCRKSARRCGAKHICKSKCTKHTSFEALLKVEMSKKCTPLWRSTFRSQNVQNTPCTDHFCRFRCRFAWQAQGIVDLVKSEQNLRVLWHFQLQPPLHYTTFQYITLQLQLQLHLYYILLHYTPLHYTALNYIQLHYTTRHYSTHQYTPLHYITLHYIILHYIPIHYITLHYTSFHYITLHSTTLQLHLQLHSTTLNYTTLHYTTLHYIPRHSTTLHYITLNDTAPQVDR